MTLLALSQTVISSDVVSSSGPRHRQVHLDRAHEAVLDQAFHAVRDSRYPIASAFRRVDGDSTTMVVNADVPRSWIIADFILREIVIALADVNRAAAEESTLRLRMAVDFGEIVLNPPHVGGDAVVCAARLRDAPALREAMSGNQEAHLGLIVSDRCHAEVIKHGERGLTPGLFQATEVKVKTFSERGWIHLPGLTTTAAQPQPTSTPHTAPVMRADVINKFEETVNATGAVFGVVHDRRR